MRFQECTARSIVVSMAKDEVSRMYCKSIVVSTTKDEVARMYCRINCGFHSQK
jgi:hypothetical protein